MTNIVLQILFQVFKKTPKAKSRAYRQYDLYSITNLKLYETRLERKNKGKKLPEDHIDDWKTVTGKRVCRI